MSFPHGLPQIEQIPTPSAHPRVPEVLADVDVDLLDVEGEQTESLALVMNCIYMKPLPGTKRVVPAPEAFIDPLRLALHAARLPEAEHRRLHTITSR